MKEVEQYILNKVSTVMIRHLEPIFKEGTQLTMIARSPGNNEADVVVTSDEAGALDELLHRRFPELPKVVLQEDYDRLVQQMDAAKALITEVYGRLGQGYLHSPTREYIEKNTGSWFVKGLNRDQLSELERMEKAAFKLYSDEASVAPEKYLPWLTLPEETKKLYRDRVSAPKEG